MYLKELLKSVGIQRVTNDSLGSVSPEKEKLIRVFIDALLDEDNCQAVFRGEDRVSAYEQSGANTTTSLGREQLLATHSDIIFYIGTKSRSYLYATDGIDVPIEIRSLDNSVFKTIFNEIEHSIEDGLYSGESEFTRYFCRANRDSFIEKISLVDDEEKQQIKIYYLWLLHVIGETEYKRYSNFLSTTKNHKVANRFGHDQIVYCGWIPRPIKKRAAYLGSLIQLEQRLKHLDLPTYNDEPYPDEQEISLLGGLFPHYTLGIFDPSTRKLIINTHLLDNAILDLISNGMSELVINLGIFIDQSEFESSEKLRNSKYRRWVSHSEGESFTDHNVHR
ncbi:hypothetical protein Cpar_1104 [Chlorobaculum parvum NCIB 8327]|uniref:Uncharacterized protein n=1 Tax=Chlorobaculum parvum (strain DSM 263 / NCIMB 8327) TaxID=517417 RepID=B3QNK8_CHLP8|nr:hypothetical protein [Chlorobaculum parvum]ACF11511.1 hypothetical protein Cpar_1104 [Chlorobaculum parvum NCIB 8327]